MRNNYIQGSIYYFKLDPTKGSEPKKTRPCLIISNNQFNKHYNTIWVLPISSSDKYNTQLRYRESPMFVHIKTSQISGTILIQHIRDINPYICRFGPCKGKISQRKIKRIKKLIMLSI